MVLRGVPRSRRFNVLVIRGDGDAHDGVPQLVPRPITQRSHWKRVDSLFQIHDELLDRRVLAARDLRQTYDDGLDFAVIV